MFSLLFRLIALAFLVFVGTSIWIVYDGLYDQGEHADAAVVPGSAVRHDGAPAPVLRARLDRAIELYRLGKFPLIIVSGANHLGDYNESASMKDYLQAHQVPAGAIVQDQEGANTADTAQDLARIMKERNLHTVMIVTHYYHITRMKLALKHAGIKEIEQAHVGVVQKDDVFNLGREVIAIYYYLARFYVIPAAEKAKEEAKVEAGKAKETVDKKLDSLSK